MVGPRITNTQADAPRLHEQQPRTDVYEPVADADHSAAEHAHGADRPWRGAQDRAVFENRFPDP
jgi:hypothetical protein